MYPDLAVPSTTLEPRPVAATSQPGPLTELALACGAALVFFALAGVLGLSEKVALWTHSYEHWQLDELPLTLLLLSVGLAILAFRRGNAARRELAERVRAEARIAALLAQNRELAQRLMRAQENERCALARELHDEVGQNCTAIRAEASYIMHAGAHDAAVVGAAGRIAGASERLYTLVRDMLQRLRPPVLDSLGLEPALQELCESWERQSGVACAFFPRVPTDGLDDATCIAVFRLVQEGLTNVARHAGADQVRIDLRLGADGAGLALRIEDNGRGMDGAATRRGGFGLLGMRERVAGLTGSMEITSAPGRGMRIDVTLPAAPASA